MSKKLSKKITKQIRNSAIGVDRSLVICFLKANPNKYYLSELAGKFGISKQLLQSFLNSKEYQDQNLASLLTSKQERINKQIYELITQNPHQLTAAEVSKQINHLTKSVLQKAVKLGIDHLLIPKINIQERTSQALELLKQNPGTYEYSPLAKKFGLNTSDFKALAIKHNLDKDFVSKKRYGLAKQIVETIKQNPNKYSVTQIANLYNSNHSYILQLLRKHHLSSMVLNPEKSNSKDVQNLKTCLITYPNQFTVRQLAEKFGWSKMKIAGIIRRNQGIRDLVVIRKGKRVK